MLEMDDKLADLYYSPRGYWKGLAAIKYLTAAVRVALAQEKHASAGKTKVSADVVHSWLKKQAIWQIYLPAGCSSLRTPSEIRRRNTERGPPG